MTTVSHPSGRKHASTRCGSIAAKATALGGTMAEELAATAAFNELIDTLTAIRDDYVLADGRLRDDL
jgi:hypothetical protein